MNIFVFRLGTRGEGGTPLGTCDLHLHQNVTSIFKNIKTVSCSVDNTNYSGVPYYLLCELLFGRLRQGWGMGDPHNYLTLGNNLNSRLLDLRLPKERWIAHYMKICELYWSAPPDCGIALGRWRILTRMLIMNPGDVVFVPKTPDENHYSITTVKAGYQWDISSSLPFNDYRHVIQVENIKCCPYDESTLQSDDFGAPFLYAVREVKPHYVSYQKLKSIAIHYIQSQSSNCLSYIDCLSGAISAQLI